MKNKAIAAVVSLVLVLAISLPVSLSLSSDTDSKQSAAGTMAPAVQAASAGTVEQSAPAEADVPAAVCKHADGCSDSCTGDGCLCGCHLFTRIMACTTLDEIWAIIDGATDAQLNALTEEQNALIDAKITALEPAPAPAVVIEESNDETVPSEIVYPTVNYTDVAPFGEPVTGGQN